MLQHTHRHTHVHTLLAWSHTVTHLCKSGHLSGFMFLNIFTCVYKLTGQWTSIARHKLTTRCPYRSHFLSPSWLILLIVSDGHIQTQLWSIWTQMEHFRGHTNVHACTHTHTCRYIHAGNMHAHWSTFMYIHDPILTNRQRSVPCTALPRLSRGQVSFPVHRPAHTT